MEFLITLIMFVGGLYIFKNLIFVFLPYVSDFIYKYNLSRSEDGNFLIGFVLTPILALATLFVFLGLIHKIFGNFDVVIVILVSLYFRFGTDKGRMPD